MEIAEITAAEILEEYQGEEENVAQDDEAVTEKEDK